MTVKDLCALEEINTVTLPDPDREINGAYIGDLLSWVMGRAQEGNVWITIMSNINVAAVASLSDVACVILAEGVKLDDEVRNTAEQKGINVLCSNEPIFETAAMLFGKV